MIRRYVLALVTAAALTTALCAMADENQPDGSQTGGTGSQMGSSGSQTGTGDMSDVTSQDVDRAALAVLISHARLQRQLSDLVAQKATDPGVKNLAQQIASDQDQWSKRFQDAAQQAGVTIHPDRMLPRDQAVLDYMKQIPTAALERNYVFHEAGTTQTQMLYAQWLANNAQKPQVKQVAQEFATKLQERSQTIQPLAQAQISGGAQPAGGRMPPSGGGQQ
jgi:predicted outer membrane protein